MPEQKFVNYVAREKKGKLFLMQSPVNTFLSRLKPIWPISSQKISKMHFWWKAQWVKVHRRLYMYLNFWRFLFYIFRTQQGSAPYVIEVGGSSYVGMFGYLTAFQEMINQVI